ncbi:MAG: hypothetical protein Q9169_000387 [Polycauliona sp. 2 TL-2023]
MCELSNTRHPQRLLQGQSIRESRFIGRTHLSFFIGKFSDINHGDLPYKLRLAILLLLSFSFDGQVQLQPILMHPAQPVFPHHSDDCHCQQRTLPSIRDLLEQGEFQPDDERLSHDRQSTANLTFPDALLRRRPCLPIQEFGTFKAQDIAESRSDVLISSKDGKTPKKKSLGKKPSNAHGSDGGPLVDVTESLVSCWQTETIKRPHKRDIEDEALQDFSAAPKRRKLERKANINERCRKQEGSKTAAIAHMEKERERRLHIGDLIKQIASLIQFQGPKVEILKRTVDCIQDAKSRSASLEKELRDLKRRYQS